MLSVTYTFVVLVLLYICHLFLIFATIARSTEQLPLSIFFRFDIWFFFPFFGMLEVNACQIRVARPLAQNAQLHASRK
jgi:hypothetical protein